MYVVEIKPNGIIKCKWILYEPFSLVEDNDNQFINYAVYIAGVNYNTTNGNITSNIQKSTCGVINLTQTSMNLGEGNLAGGFGTIAAGHDNIVNGWYSSAFGKGHQVNSYASGTFGRTNTINSANFCFSAGQSNNITGSQDITVLAGYDIPNGDGNAVFGRINRCKNSIGCGIFGIDNNATSSITSLICGVQNSANGGYNLLVGQSNKIKSSNHNAVIGINNEVTGPRSFAIGQSLIGKTEQLVIGKYNAEDVNAAFIIGQGTNGSNRKNIFTVSKTGEVNVNGKFVVDGVSAGPGCISIENCAGYKDHKTTITNTELKIDKGVNYGNHDSVTLNSDELSFKKQEGTDTAVFKPGYALLYGDHYQSIELKTDYPYNGIGIYSRPACILEDAGRSDVGSGKIILTPTCIEMTECTSIDEYDSPVLETVKIEVSYFKSLEARIAALEAKLQ